MKKKKMVVQIALVAMVGLMLQGCSKNTKEGEATTGASTAPTTEASAAVSTGAPAKAVTLKVWGDLPNQAVLEEPFKKINAAFAAKYPNITVQFDFAQNDQSLNVALQANELPDLFFVQGDKTPKMTEMVKNGFLLPLDDYKLDLSRFTDSEKAYSLVDGKMYSSLPSFFDTNVVYYNKDLFEKNSLKVPATWDEFTATLDTLKGKGVTPISLPGKSEWIVPGRPSLSHLPLQMML